MLTYFIQNYDRLLDALIEHLQIVLTALSFSFAISFLITMFLMFFPQLREMLLQFLAMVYSIPSLALFALFIPVSGLGKQTTLIVLIIYNQYLLLQNFLVGISEVDSAVVEAAVGLGMGRIHLFTKIQLPLAKRAFFTGIKLAAVSTVGTATIAALINAGGLGKILFDGLRTINLYKVVWGSIFSAGLAIGLNALFRFFEKIIK